MKKIILALVVLAAGFALAITLIKIKPGPPVRPEAPAALPSVNIVQSEARSLRLPVISQGTVRPSMEIDLVAQVGGLVEQTHPAFADGGYVKQGEVLVSIEADDYEIALVRAQAQVAEAQQALATERARSNQARKEWHDLGHADANALFLRKPQLKSAEAAYDAALADLRAAELKLARTRISAPFNGRIRSKLVDRGQYLSPGSPVARFYASDTLEVRLPLNDRQIGLLELPAAAGSEDSDYQGPTVTLSASFGGQQGHWTGHLVRSEASIDIQSRMLFVIVAIAGSEQSENSLDMPLKVGQFVNAEIQGKLLDDVIKLPQQALQVGDKLMVLDQDDRIRFVPVTVLQQYQGEVYVKAPLEDGSRVVITNLPMAVEGMRVSLSASPTPSAQTALIEEH